MSWVSIVCFAMGLESTYEEHCVRGHAKKGEYFLHTLLLLFRRRKFQKSTDVSSRIFPPSQEMSSYLPDWDERRVEFLIYTF